MAPLPQAFRIPALKLGLVLLTLAAAPDRASAQPTVVDPALIVQPVVTGLSSPTTMAYLGPQDFLVLEKNTGRVVRVTNGVIQGAVLDLAVNFASERGLLGIALHPAFPVDPGVYLFWTESSSGSDSNVLSDVPLLGNRVDRFLWNGSTLAFDRNLLRLRARQTDNVPVPGHPGTNNASERGNHNGGVLAFGPDGKLYVFLGDVGRRGWLQNLPTGPFASPPFVDDTFGGPEPDAAHLAGVVLRLNPDGTTPPDNPFFAAGGAIGGQVGVNVQRLFSYGHRNGFGMAFDPASGGLWLAENGNDAFSELNRVLPGMNGGWVQVAGPVDRITQFKEIETTFGAQNLQQVRWPASNIADTPAEALARMFVLPGAVYRDPAFSWKWEVAPGGLGFLSGGGLGASLAGSLFVGAATPALEGGYLFRFPLSPDRSAVDVPDPRLADRVADNLAKFDLTESEALLFGRDFGIVTHIGTAPNGNLVVVSLSLGAVYEVARRPPVADTTPPVCGPIRVEYDGPGGALSAIASSASDPESGIASVAFTTLRNLRGYLDGAGPYAQGQTVALPEPHPAEVSFRGERISFSAGGALLVRVTNGAGLWRDCDPVVSQLSATAPEAFVLEPAYPNPVRAGSAVRITFALAEAGRARITVYDLVGREVIRLLDGPMEPGRYEMTWEGDDSTGRPLPAGAYLYRLEAGPFSQTLQVVLLP
jgi:aldose sugar dehydrogenase